MTRRQLILAACVAVVVTGSADASRMAVLGRRAALTGILAPVVHSGWGAALPGVGGNAGRGIE